MTVEPSIRRAGAADGEALAALRYEFRAELAVASEPRDEFLARCRLWIETRLTMAPSWQCWVADRAGEHAGMAWLHLIAKLPNPVSEREWHGYITSLYVRPDQRGHGLGSALLATVLAECEARLVDSVILWPTPRSRSLYARHGFAVPESLLERRLAPSGPRPGAAV